MLSDNINHWLICALLLFLGSAVQSALGFGMALIAAPVMVILVPEWVPVILIILAFPLTLRTCWEQRTYLRWQRIGLPMLTRIPGLVLGIYTLLVVSTMHLQLIVAICVILAVLISAFGRAFQPTQFRLGLAGLVSGFTGITTSIGGPPMVLVMQYDDPPSVRANLSAFFAAGCALSLISYAWTGMLDKQLFWIGVSFLPITWLGYKVGFKLRPRIHPEVFRPVLLWLCAGAGLVALVNALTAAV